MVPRLAVITIGGVQRAVDLLGAGIPTPTFDPRTADYAALTGPTTDPTATIDTPDDTGRYVLGSAASDMIGAHVVDPVQYVDAYIGGGAGTRQVDTLIQDSIIDVPVKVNMVSTPLTLTVERTRLSTSYAKQAALGAISSVLFGLMGAVRDCDLSAAVDAVQSMGGVVSNPAYITTMDRCWLHAQHPWPYTSGYPWDEVTPFPLDPSATGLSASTGTYLTDAQQEEAGTTDWEPDVQVQPGDLRMALASATVGKYALQCVAAGTSGSGTSGRPDVQTAGGADGGVLHYNGTPLLLKDAPAGVEPSYVLQGGTARWITVGPANHSDGMQWSRGGHTTVTRSRLEGASNDCLLVQATQAGQDGATVPTKLVTVDQCLLITGQPDPSTTHIIQVNAQSSIAAYGTSGGAVYTGYYRWSAGDVWTVNSQGAKSRPWYVTISNCFFGDLPAGGEPTFAQCIGTASRSGDHAIFVRDEATRDAGVAAQYGITLTEAQAMREPGYDWTGSTPAVIESVLNARLATFDAALTIAGTDAGAHQSKVDARTWIVWDSNATATSETPLHPAVWAGKTGFDADGYYTGG